MSDPAYQALLERIAAARMEGKSVGEMMQMAVDFLAGQPKEYSESRRDELLAQVKMLQAQAPLIEQVMNAAKSGDEKAGMMGMLSLFAKMQDARPREEKEAKRKEC